MSPDEYCARKAAPEGSALYYALRLAPPARRPPVAAVHAFCRELREGALEVSDPSVARLKLGWWRAEIVAAFEARAHHPIAQALAPAVAAFKLPQRLFEEVIDGIAFDAGRVAYSDFAALEAHCRRVGGGIAELSARILSGTEAASAYARDLGVALQLTAIVQRLGGDLHRGRMYLPEEELARFEVTREDLGQRRATSGFAALMAHQAQRTRDFYARSHAAFAAMPASERHAQRPGRALAAIGQALLDEIEGDDYRVLDRRISLTPLAKAWITWKTSWRR